MHLIYYLSCLVAPLSLASALLPRNTPAIRSLYTFPPNTFIENIAVRSNSHLLLNSLSVPTLFTLDPLVPSPTPSIVHTFANGTGNAGITEISPDIFAVLNGIWDIAIQRAAFGSFTIWTIDFSSPGNSPIVKHVANVPNSNALNGIAAIPYTPYILASDSVLGAVWRINIVTGAVNIAFSSPLFLPQNSSLVGENIGINGIKVHNSFLYFATSAQGLFGRVLIDKEGDQVGDIEVLANLNTTTTQLFVDDFAIGEDGTAWIATHPNQVVRVAPDGTQLVIANASLLLNPTSAALGRGSREQEKILYVTDGGEFLATGLVDEGVVALDTTQF